MKLNLPAYFATADQATKDQLWKLAVEQALNDLEKEIKRVDGKPAQVKVVEKVIEKVVDKAVDKAFEKPVIKSLLDRLFKK